MVGLGEPVVDVGLGAGVFVSELREVLLGGESVEEPDDGVDCGAAESDCTAGGLVSTTGESNDGIDVVPAEEGGGAEVAADGDWSEEDLSATRMRMRKSLPQAIRWWRQWKATILRVTSGLTRWFCRWLL